jgi:hypothetical protein
MGWIFLYVVWFGFSALVGYLASQTGRSGTGWFVLSLAISPIAAALILVFLSNDKSEKQ